MERFYIDLSVSEMLPLIIPVILLFLVVILLFSLRSNRPLPLRSSSKVSGHSEALNLVLMRRLPYFMNDFWPFCFVLLQKVSIRYVDEILNARNGIGRVALL